MRFEDTSLKGGLISWSNIRATIVKPQTLLMLYLGKYATKLRPCLHSNPVAAINWLWEPGTVK